MKSNSILGGGPGKLKESFKDRTDLSRKSKADNNLSKKLDSVGLGLSSGKAKNSMGLLGKKKPRKGSDNDTDDSMTF